MMELTKERIEQFIKSPIDNGLTRSEQMSMARQLLAVMEQEPVAWLHYSVNGAPNFNANKPRPRKGNSDAIALYFSPPAPVVPDGYAMVPVDMAPEMMRAVQFNSELGGYAAANLSGAYSLFREFWDVAIAAAPRQEADNG